MTTELLPYPPLTDELLSEATSRILSAGSPLKIILFGSRARGDSHPFSDLDLLIIEETTEPSHRRDAHYRRAVRGVFPETDILVYTPSEVAEWAEVPHVFVTTAVREGRLLYAR